MLINFFPNACKEKKREREERKEEGKVDKLLPRKTETNTDRRKIFEHGDKCKREELFMEVIYNRIM